MINLKAETTVILAKYGFTVRETGNGEEVELLKDGQSTGIKEYCFNALYEKCLNSTKGKNKLGNELAALDAKFMQGVVWDVSKLINV